MYKDLAGIPFCAIDVIADASDVDVNGVIFSVGADHLPALKRRELGYRMIETLAYDFETGKPLGTCFVFSANKRDGRYASGEPAQERYTKLCLDAAKEYGDEFYRQFLATTYIGDEVLGKVLDLINK